MRRLRLYAFVVFVAGVVRVFVVVAATRVA